MRTTPKSAKKRRTNWDRVTELNEILGPVREMTGYYFSLISPRWMFRHPYALCYRMSPEHSLDFKGMKAMALRMRTAYDNGGDKTAIYKARYDF